MQETVMKFSRRSFVAGALGILAAPTVLRAQSKDSGSVIVSIEGGSMQEIMTKHVLKPFTEETGIRVQPIPRVEMAKLKAQLITGQVQVDVVSPYDGEAVYGSKNAYWDKLDLSMLDVGDMVIPPTSELVFTDTYVGGIAWNPKRFDEGKHPRNFAEFFDVKKFPGRRVLPQRPGAVLEVALIADGVPPNRVYPLDLDRAFKVLDRLKPSVAAWQSAPAAVVSMLQNGEVDFAYTSVNRIKATNDAGGGAPLAISLDQNIFYTDQLAIPKGAPNKANAMKYIAYFMRPQVLAGVCESTAFVPNSKKATTMLSANTRKWIPDLANPNSLFSNANYWEENLEPVSRRFLEWVRS
jgi:putative spermidine/putrescine transport system substrate-binding protein